MDLHTKEGQKKALIYLFVAVIVMGTITFATLYAENPWLQGSIKNLMNLISPK